MNLTPIGVSAAAVALAGLGLVEVIFAAPLPGLHQLPEAAPSWLARGLGALLALTAVSLQFNSIAALLLGVLWSAMVVPAIAAVVSADDVVSWVPAAEAGIFAAFAIWRWDEGRGWPILRVVFGVALLFFGAVHLLHRDIIATLIPEWIPWREHWPWFTGGINAVAGLACVLGRRAALSAGMVGVMYLSWLPVVHAARLAAAADSLFEWTFALTALALAGVAMAVAGRAQAKIATPDR
ncbi:MAG: hypothetical protein AB7H66_02770 [Hyphomonadaceae bacterium]